MEWFVINSCFKLPPLNDNVFIVWWLNSWANFNTCGQKELLNVKKQLELCNVLQNVVNSMKSFSEKPLDK